MSNTDFYDLISKEISVLMPVQKAPIKYIIARLLNVLFKRLISAKCNRIIKSARIELDVYDSNSIIEERFFEINFTHYKVREL